MGRVQQNYNINPTTGFIGDLAEPSAPHLSDSGVIHVPTSGRKPRPGDAVYWNRTENAFSIPTDAATLRLVCGLLTYRKDQVASSTSVVEYSDGDEIEVAKLGAYWVKAGSAMEYEDRIAWDVADYQWDPDPITDFVADGSDLTTTQALANNIKAILNEVGRYPIVCVSRLPVAASGIAKARIGYGRVL